MLTIVWFLSGATSSPIVFGVNRTSERALTPTLCTFYNSDFIIYSSLVSFYLPCIIMIYLYGRIFRTIRQRARLSLRRKRFLLHSGDRPNCGQGRNTGDHEEDETREPCPLAESEETNFANLVSESNTGRSDSQNGDEEILVPELPCLSVHKIQEPSFVAEHGQSLEHLQLLTDIEGSAEQLIATPPGEFEPNDNQFVSTEREVLLTQSECSPSDGDERVSIGVNISPRSELKTNDPASCSYAEQRNISPPSECMTNDTVATVPPGSHQPTVIRRRKDSGLSVVERKATKTLAIVIGIHFSASLKLTCTS